MDETKICSKCRQAFPASPDYFPLLKGKLMAQCRSCKRARERRWHAANLETAQARNRRYREAHQEQIRERNKQRWQLYKKPPRFADPPGMRQCSQCGEVKPATADFFFRQTKTRLHRACKSCVNQATRLHRKAHPEKFRPSAAVAQRRKERQRADTLKRPEYYKALNKKSKQKLKQEMVDAYGGCCSCCGETALEFLTLEHIDHNGKEHRQRLGQGPPIWRDLKSKGWPQDGFTVYCWNCQMATRYGDPCPHTRSL